jgi:hypothetical protein
MSLSGEVAGSLSFPVGTISLAGNNIDPGGQKIKAVNFEFYLDGERLFLDECRAEFPEEEEIRALGWLSPAGEYHIVALSEGISLNHIDWIADQDWKEAKIFFDFHGEGSFEDPGLSGKIGLRNLQLNEKKFDPFSLKVEVADRKVKIAGEEGTALNAEYSLETKEIEGEVRARSLD